MITVETQSLPKELGSYRFCICTGVWYDVLSKIQDVSKLIQSSSMQLGIAVDLLKKTKHFLTCYRKSGFAATKIKVKQICEEMSLEAELKQKRLRSSKRHFDYESLDESIQDALPITETTNFNLFVYTRICVYERFQSLEEVNKIFAVLYEFTNLGREDLLQKCKNSKYFSYP
ncbi:uncharacterized protein [Lepeophtheirus salmonis]|uniref:uncharacterized protein n=1 Tax=Lepeophtheirus salmonis TaxID=72036 RepID=UPI003AF35599